MKKVDHVSMAAWDLEKQISLMEKLFGMQVLGRWRSDADQYEGANLSIPGTNIEFEIIVPTTEESFVAKFLKERGPGLHHITVEVNSIEGAAQELRDQGIEPFRGINNEDGWLTTYVHPKDSGGILFQLFERADGPAAK